MLAVAPLNAIPHDMDELQLNQPLDQLNQPLDGATGTVYIIRHGEKNAAGNHLNETGLARAQWVSEAWGGGPCTLYAPPKAMFANFFKEEYNSVELATPLANKLGLQLNTSHHRPAVGYNNSAAADAIRQALRASGGPVMAVWESSNIVALARDVGCNRSWMEKYDGRNWGHVPEHATTQFKKFFILELNNGICEDIKLHTECFPNCDSLENICSDTFSMVSLPVAVPLLVFLACLRILCSTGYCRSEKDPGFKVPLLKQMSYENECNVC